MHHQSSLSLGVEYRVSVRDPNTQCIKYETPWCHNLILDNSGALFNTGFTSTPVPILGSNGTAVAASQKGVLTPLAEMRNVSIAHDPNANSWEQIAPNVASAAWRYEFEYINVSNTTVTLREIGLDGFSRALLIDNEGKPANIPIAQYDQLTVGMRFIMSFNHQNQTVNITDIGGGVIDTFTVSYKVSPPLNLADGVWWKLFALTDPIILVTDAGPVNVPNYGLTTTVNSRNINYRLSITAEDAYNWTGLKYYFASKTPIVEAVFSKPISVPASQKFELVLNPKW